MTLNFNLDFQPVRHAHMHHIGSFRIQVGNSVLYFRSRIHRTLFTNYSCTVFTWIEVNYGVTSNGGAEC